MAKLTGNIIQAGLHIWVPSRTGKNLVPVEMIVVTGIVKSHSRLQVAYINEQDIKTQAASTNYDSEHADYSNYYIYLGDRGVHPYEYDGRVTQIFTTKEELEAAITNWNGEHPNFIYQE